MDKLNMRSKDFVVENIEKIAELFPNCVTEKKSESGELERSIDFDALRQELSDSIVEGSQERYSLNWPGKREALVTANTPISKTLRPCRDESVDFDNTKNIFIEGDNLDALKLLQETYLSKIKMIYIDPPYNTGNDFIYNDNFTADKDEYDIDSGQRDEEGGRLVANPDSNGRYHSDWLSMIYPRLKLAYNLLADDGVLVLSIDDNEIINLRKICDDIFGENNFLYQVTVLCNPKGRSQDKYVANCHEYLVSYSRKSLNKGDLNIPKPKAEIEKNYKLEDERGCYREIELRNTHREFGKHNRAKMFFPIYVDSEGKVSLSECEGKTSILPLWDDGFEGCWTWGFEKAAKQIDELVAKSIKGSWKIYRKNYAHDEDGEASKQVKSIWTEKCFHTEKGQTTFNGLFQTKEKIFQSPKSLDVLKQSLLMSSSKNSLILDFFAGSGTTSHAVMQLNAEDGGIRQCISVQLPEVTDNKSEAFKAGYKNIAEISKERIRRAGRKIKEERADIEGIENLDTGFRVFKIDSSNMVDVHVSPDEATPELFDTHVKNIKKGRSSEDLLFQVLLDWGVDLSLPIVREEIAGKEVFFVDGNALVACFDDGICEQFVTQLATRKPLRVVFRDDGFGSGKDGDSVKINVEQVFKLKSPATDIKVI